MTTTRPAVCALAALTLCLTAACGSKERGRTQAKITAIKVSDAATAHRVLKGVLPGDGEWRWTARAFAVRLDRPLATGAPIYFEMDLTVPQETMAQGTPVTIIVRANHREACRGSFTQSGRQLLSCHVPDRALEPSPVEIEVEADKSFSNWQDGAERSLILVSLGLMEYENTQEYSQREAARAREAYNKVLEQWRQYPPDRVREMTQLFHKLPVWQSVWFHNVRLIKNPLDLWMMQQILWEVKPDFVVETGTFRGGSALYWASLLHGMGLEESRVLTVDLGDAHRAAAAHFLWKNYVRFFRGSSTDPALVARIAAAVKGKKVVVTLDSDHAMAHVLRELKMYAPLVSRGSYLVVEDTHMDAVPTYPHSGAGPAAAVRKFLAEGGSAEFEQDFSREAFLMTFNPGGWLRRK